MDCAGFSSEWATIRTQRAFPGLLASVITTINNTRADTELFKPLVIKNFGLPPDA